VVVAGVLASMFGVAAIAALCLVVRTVNRQAESTLLAIVMSPANEAATCDSARAVVKTVVALDDEMLVELHSSTQWNDPSESTMWLHSPTNVAATITLTRWRDARVHIEVRRTPYGVVLFDDQARVSLSHAHVDVAR